MVMIHCIQNEIIKNKNIFKKVRKKSSPIFVAHVISEVWPSSGAWMVFQEHHTSYLICKENWSPLSHQLCIANGSSSMYGTLCAPPFSMLRLCLVGASAGLLHALITNESSYVHVVTAGVLTAEALFYLKSTIPCHHPPALPLTICLPLPFGSDPWGLSREDAL